MKQKLALLRNNSQGDQLKTHLPCLYAEPILLFVSSPPFLLVKNGCIVLLLTGDHVVNDPCEFMGGGSHGFRNSHPGFHASEIVSEKTIASMQSLRSNTQGEGSAILGRARPRG